MVQLKLSSAFNKGLKHDHKVVCVQRTDIGLYVGTIRETEDGYMGHILSPKHPLLASTPGDGHLGFLASNRDEAFEVLALHVAKTAWNGTLGFEATCLDNCSRQTRNAFVEWLVTHICDARASVFHSKPADQSKHGSSAVRIRADVARERADMISRNFFNLHNSSERLQ